MDANEFWKNINNILKSRNMSQEDLCNLCGLNLGTFRNRISKGRLPDAFEVYSIARVLGTTVEYLVTGEDTQPADSTRNLKREILAVLSNY